MIFFGFYCVRKLLISLNIFFMILSTILISVGVYANSISIVTTSIIGGIIFCGVFLFLIAFVGLIGTLKHHQVLLFFYMTFLLLSFLIQFIIAVVCLAVISVNSQADLLLTGWKKLNYKTIEDIQIKNNCCGFNVMNLNDTTLPKCPVTANKPCLEVIQDSVVKALQISGAIALTFSFINLSGVWLAIRFRNQRDPKCNPNQYL